MKNRLRSFGGFALAGALLYSCSLSGLAQTTSGAKATSDDRDWYKYSIGIFGGEQFWKNQSGNHESVANNPLGGGYGNPISFAPGGALGVRANQDFLNYLGVEEAWTFYARNNIRLVPVQPYTAETVGFGNYDGQVYIGPLFYLTPRGSRV